VDFWAGAGVEREVGHGFSRIYSDKPAAFGFRFTSSCFENPVVRIANDNFAHDDVRGLIYPGTSWI
jgi:N-acetylglutamate synthase/N-acetylornithine aminotransferase